MGTLVVNRSFLWTVVCFSFTLRKSLADYWSSLCGGLVGSLLDSFSAGLSSFFSSLSSVQFFVCFFPFFRWFVLCSLPFSFLCLLYFGYLFFFFYYFYIFFFYRSPSLFFPPFLSHPLFFLMTLTPSRLYCCGYPPPLHRGGRILPPLSFRFVFVSGYLVLLIIFFRMFASFPVLLIFVIRRLFYPHSTCLFVLHPSSSLSSVLFCVTTLTLLVWSYSSIPPPIADAYWWLFSCNAKRRPVFSPPFSLFSFPPFLLFFSRLSRLFLLRTWSFVMSILFCFPNMSSYVLCRVGMASSPFACLTALVRDASFLILIVNFGWTSFLVWIPFPEFSYYAVLWVYHLSSPLLSSHMCR